jgi:hypothetical protein
VKDLKERYDSMLEDLEAFLQTETSYKDLTVEQFQNESKLFWERTGIWELAYAQELYPKEKLDEDFSRIKLHAKRLLL